MTQQQTASTPTNIFISFLLPFPLLPYPELHPRFIRRIVEDSIVHLEKMKSSATYEVLLIPYGEDVEKASMLMEEAKRLAKENNGVTLLPAHVSRLRGAAILEAFSLSQGHLILIGHSLQPCDFSFFVEALPLLNSGVDLVRANRRLPQTRFRIPVRLLPYVYRRHRLGLRFNRLVKRFLPITTTDTHSGNLCVTRRLAVEAFARRPASDFLIDLEISLTAIAHGYKDQDLPVKLHLDHEKNIRRMLIETIDIMKGLPIMAYRYRSGYYGPVDESAQPKKN